MPNYDTSLIDTIRAASRKMVRELGFMRATLAATDYPPSAVHAIMEIGTRRSLTAAELGEFLNLEKSSISRMVRKLIEAGELKETVSSGDARAKLLSLTPRGRRTLAAIHAFGRQQVTSAMSHLTITQQEVVVHGLTVYAQALENHRLGKLATPENQIQIERGYMPGLIGRIVQMHASFYARRAGFGQFFESQVATGMAEFSARAEKHRNGLWVALLGSLIVGSIAIDSEDLGDGIAHLRWFIVDDGLRDAGVGRRLLAKALAFCDQQGFAAIHLWTFQGLDAARSLYEDFGFILVEERPGSQWGKEVVEQRFIRVPPCTS